ncbi:MAG: hypothetical protein HOC74_41175 [Gemmatimonadetes bacterium]|jgi:hypothetical protein|nr:hypothetical protein [Gemmatimonadota bacterium]
MAPLTHRECFNKVMTGETTDWVPNYELGGWGQTVTTPSRRRSPTMILCITWS